jgi:hypothetical protein
MYYWSIYTSSLKYYLTLTRINPPEADKPELTIEYLWKSPRSVFYYKIDPPEAGPQPWPRPITSMVFS